MSACMLMYKHAFSARKSFNWNLKRPAADGQKGNACGRLASLTVLWHAAALFLPRGYPESVSEDYLDYQLWAFPSHVLVSPSM